MVEYDDLYSTPVGTQLDRVKNLTVSRILYSESSTDEELTSDTFIYEGTNVMYYFSDACYGYDAGIVEGESGQSASIISSGAYYAEIGLSGVDIGAEVKISVTGRKYNASKSTCTITVNNRGSDVTWENPLISDYEHCKEVCEWIADYLASGIEYELDYRGEPALDVGDTVFQENKYDPDLKVVVEESHISFNGGISGALRTRRKERVDRAKNGLGNHRQI